MRARVGACVCVHVCVRVRARACVWVCVCVISLNRINLQVCNSWAQNRNYSSVSLKNEAGGEKSWLTSPNNKVETATQEKDALPSLGGEHACLQEVPTSISFLPWMCYLSTNSRKKIQIIQRRLLSSSQGPQNAAMTDDTPIIHMHSPLRVTNQ